MEEDKKIIQYIIENKNFSYIHGPKMWKEIESCEVVPNRSWSGLISGLNEVIFPKIEAYTLTKSDQPKFKNIK